ncbi:hypothetical protein HHK36_031956 [Tetracentron sinense]|uniref:Proteasome alpha-type subunits domain-containing protein n=1 Tax=Tetracentron sinense TaxID=13715 RepID=A0A834Y623_TETSI|nr:hypothetical protein HHK36_031956 [Tetracentron sinense]
MSSIGTGYDLSVTTFSPDGRVFQIEYAAKAVDNSGTVIGIKCKDGIVMGVEKLIASKMMLPGSNRRIHSIHRHSGMVNCKALQPLKHLPQNSKMLVPLERGRFLQLRRITAVICASKCLHERFQYFTNWGVAGLAADGRQIVARAKSEATNYERIHCCTFTILNIVLNCSSSTVVIVRFCSVYGEPIPVKELADRVASYVHLCTLYWWLRPFGCGVILGGYDRDGPQLYMVEPSGVSHRYFGAAIGKGRQAAKTEIEKLKLSEMTCRQGVIEVAKIIYGVHDEAKDKAFELEMSWVCDESNRQHQKVISSLLKGLLEEAKAAAKAALEEMDAD